MAAKATYETILQDNGKWVSKIIDSGSQYSANRIFINFLNFELNHRFANSRKEIEIQKVMLEKRLV